MYLEQFMRMALADHNNHEVYKKFKQLLLWKLLKVTELDSLDIYIELMTQT